MKHLYLIILLCWSTTAFAQNQEKGKDFIHAYLVEKDYDKAYDFFDDNMKSKMAVPVLEKTLEQLTNQIGAFQNIIEVNNEGTVYYYYSAFSKMKLDINISFDDLNLINGLYFQPHKEFSSVPRLGEDLEIPSKGINLKGTLLRAKSEDDKKLVIFVHGSGPNDRDETIFENKPFRQIAEELYTHGISSYRFDKRTLTAPQSLDKKFTIDDEVTDDVVNIIEYFSTRPEFEGYEIVALGHSLGAYLMPRIANKSPHLDKVIMLAANARPLDVLLIDQLEYIHSLDGREENKKLLEETKAKIAFMRSKEFNRESETELLPLSIPASYWLSLMEFKHLEDAKRIKIPVMIAQGERDYQVTMTDYDIWKKTLKKNKNVTFKSYPTLNHLFISGEEKSTPQEYMTKGEVDKELIKDIVSFVKKDE